MFMIFIKLFMCIRVLFEIGFYQLGGYVIYLGLDDIQMGKWEEICDIVCVFFSYNDIIMVCFFVYKVYLK